MQDAHAHGSGSYVPENCGCCSHRARPNRVGQGRGATETRAGQGTTPTVLAI